MTSSTTPRLDLGQARRRAKELLAAGRAGDPGAISRLHRPHDPVRLSDAQHAIAREHGCTDWTALVRDHETFRPTDLDEVDWDRVTEVTIVCQPEPDRVTLHRADDRWVCPHDRRLPGEDVWDDSILRIALARMGFRRQGTHVFAIDHTGRHVVFWIDGGPYSGLRPHATGVETWTGPTDEAAALLREQGDGALARLVARAAQHRAAMTYRQHQRDLQRTLTGGYLRAGTLPGGSGFGGDADDWRDARQCLTAVLDGLPSPVRFLDLGCANGHLGASFVDWGAERGVTVEPYGIDLAPELVDRAAELHPQWADRFWVGDVLDWQHPAGERFDVVHLLLDVLPDDLHGPAVNNALSLIGPGGRLLVSNYDLRESRSAERLVAALGHEVAGRTPMRTRRANGKPYGQPSVWLQR